MDFIELAAFGIVGFLAGAMAGIYVIYHLKAIQFFEGIAENLINDLSTDEELQKNLYQLGGIVGQGVKAGIGINLPVANRGGKFKMQDFLLELIGNRLANPSPSPPPQPHPQPVRKDKFFNT